MRKNIIIVSQARLLLPSTLHFPPGVHRNRCACVRALDIIVLTRRSGVAAPRRLLGRINLRQEENEQQQLQVLLSCQAGGKLHAAAIPAPLVTDPPSQTDCSAGPSRTGSVGVLQGERGGATKEMTLSPSIGGDGSVASLLLPLPLLLHLLLLALLLLLLLLLRRLLLLPLLTGISAPSRSLGSGRHQCVCVFSDGVRRW